jgi:hypothetical protein
MSLFTCVRQTAQPQLPISGFQIFSISAFSLSISAFVLRPSGCGLRTCATAGKKQKFS